ncbi:hypothetical protein JCM8097_003107 [Rhodosporidiobolus ruineniae]
MAGDTPNWRWRRSRTLSASSLRRLSSSPSRALSRVRLPRASLAASALAALVLLLWFTLAAPASDADSPRQIHLAKWMDGPPPARPNFDFDQHGGVKEDDEDEVQPDEEDDEAGETVGPDDEDVRGDVLARARPRPATRTPSDESTPLPHPFLPFSCPACSPYSSLDTSTSTSPVCAKYRSPPPGSPSPLHPDILDHSVLFPGTGQDVRRVLKRAMRSSLYGAKRVAEGKLTSGEKWEGEEPFRILVLGGSVSNCRGVDADTACWHAHVLRWFQHNFPMEGDRDLVADVPSFLLQSSSPSPINDSRQAAGKQRRKRSFGQSPSPILPDETASPSQLPFPGPSSSTLPLAPPPPSSSPLSASPPPAHALHKRSTKQKKKAKPKKKSKTVSGRRRPSTKLINGSKSATGSAFFAYCFDDEMTLRRKDVDWQLGPDLIIVESGVNDVWPGGEQATRDFERLLRRLKSLPSKPAVISLEAASLLLASTSSATTNAEYDHLPAAHYYDVPVLSAKHALFGPVAGLLPSSSSSSGRLKIEDLFLPDLHHPNERGHELLADILLSFLEQQACLAQAEVLAAAHSRLSSSFLSHETTTAREVDPALDFPRRKEEDIRPLPPRSLFSPFPHGKGADLDAAWDLPPTTCMQVGNSKLEIEPVRNSGWTKFAWARDKQYLVAETPGSSVTYRVDVGRGGSIYLDWLHSRFYDLGDVSVYLDNDRVNAVQLSGWWDLGWSIGVPTAIFHSVPPGAHEVTVELLPSSRSSHPKRSTHFRLISIISD